MYKGIVGGLLLLGAGFYGAAASAATVSCGDSSLGSREVTVTGAASPGFCYAQNGNFAGDNLSMIPGSETLILKNAQWGGDFVGGAVSGTWSIIASLWNTYDKLYIGFHFGGGGECGYDKDGDPAKPNGAPGPDCEVDPDSFIVELDSGATGGSWTTNWGNQWGLSNLYLAGVCTKEEGCDNHEVPVPGTLGLLGLGLAGLGIVRRKQQKA